MHSSLKFSGYRSDKKEEWDLDLYISVDKFDFPLNKIMVCPGSCPDKEVDVEWKLSLAIPKDSPAVDVFELIHIESVVTEITDRGVGVVVTTHSGAEAVHTFDLAELRSSRPRPVAKII